MSQVAKSGDQPSSRLRALFSPVRGDLNKVEQLLRAELSNDFPLVDRLLKHGFRLGGKRMRPALVLLCGKACGRIGHEHLVLAAAIEMIHTATLIHDDVLDEASLRRHLETVNARWDNEASILLGDYLFTHCLCLVANSIEDTFACRAIGEASKAMCEGELRQMVGRGNYDLTEKEYFDIITGKTAALCACCCRLGAHYADADETTCEVYTRFGKYLGIAFQIIDDLLDVLGDEATTGKSLGTDLVKQKATLPLIRLLGGLDQPAHDEVLAFLVRSDNHHREYLSHWFAQSDAISYSRQRAIEFSHLAKSELNQVSPSPIHENMRQLADFVVSRQH